MAWDDIDFNLIQTGMVTKGHIPDFIRETQASFGFYMQQFATALDEKQNMVQIGTPVISGLIFEEGDITAPGNGDFWTDFRTMIEGYSVIITSGAWYDDAVLTDVDNRDNYRFFTADFETAVGVEAWDILENHATMSNSELWKASIFQAFYTIYTMTKVINRTNVITSDAVTQNQPTPLATNGIYEYKATPGSVTGDRSETYASVLSTILSGVAINSTVRASATDLHRWSFQATRTYSNFFDESTWSLSYLSGSETADFMQITYLFKDLDGNNLVMNAVPLFEILSNVTTYQYVGDDAVHAAYNTNFDLVRLVGDRYYAEIAPAEVSQIGGTVNKYYFNGGMGADIPVPDTLHDETLDSAEFTQGQGFIIDRPIDFNFIELNNSALEFYIAPIVP